MEHPAGTTLPPRRTLGYAGIVIGLVLLVPVVAVWRAVGAGEVGRGVGTAMAVAATLFLVVLPLWGGLRLVRQHVVVAPDRVVVRVGDRVVRELRFDDLTEVRAVVDGSVGAVTPELTNKAVVLVGRDPAGRRTAVKVTRHLVTTIDPLLVALRPYVAARPDLVRSDLARSLLAEYDAEVDPRPQD